MRPPAGQEATLSSQIIYASPRLNNISCGFFQFNDATNVSSSVIAEPDAPSFNTETKIKCGYNKGKTYSSYADIKDVRKDLSYWNSNAKNDDQKQHLSNLKMVESMFVEKGMQSFKAGV